MPRLAERVDALINPLMLKETYQAFRSGALRVIASLALIVPLVIIGGFIGVGAHELSEVENSGRNLFLAITTALVGLGWLIAPVRAAQQLHGEIKSHTIDLIMLTSLSPWQLAFGRFQAAVLQVALLFALALPFQVACVAIGGVSMGTIALSTAFTFAFSLFQCSAALAGATVYLVSRRMGAVAILAALLYGFMHVSASMPYLRGSLQGEVVVFFSALLALDTLLFLRLAADLLTPKAVRTFASSKACLAALLAVYFLPLWVGELATASEGERAMMLSGGLGLLYLLGFAWSATPRRRSEDAPLFRRLLDDGYDATLLYCGAITALVAIVAAVRGWPSVLPVLFFVYFVFLSGVAALVHSLLPSSARTTQAYANTLGLLVAIELAGTIFCMGLRKTPGSQGLVQALGLLFPVALHDLRFTAATVPWFVTPLLIGAASILLARTRIARIAHG